MPASLSLLALTSTMTRIFILLLRNEAVRKWPLAASGDHAVRGAANHSRQPVRLQSPLDDDAVTPQGPCRARRQVVAVHRGQPFCRPVRQFVKNQLPISSAEVIQIIDYGIAVSRGSLGRTGQRGETLSAPIRDFQCQIL